MRANALITIPGIAEDLDISTWAVEMQIRKLRDNETASPAKPLQACGHGEIRAN